MTSNNNNNNDQYRIEKFVRGFHELRLMSSSHDAWENFDAQEHDTHYVYMLIELTQQIKSDHSNIPVKCLFRRVRK